MNIIITEAVENWTEEAERSSIDGVAILSPVINGSEEGADESDKELLEKGGENVEDNI